jgi:NAD(P)H-nitrite reductase large subunit
VILSELVKNGIQIHLDARIQRISMGVVEDGFVVTLANKSSVPADLVILATDLTPRIEIAKASGLACM